MASISAAFGVVVYDEHPQSVHCRNKAADAVVPGEAAVSIFDRVTVSVLPRPAPALWASILPPAAGSELRSACKERGSRSVCHSEALLQSALVSTIHRLAIAHTGALGNGKSDSLRAQSDHCHPEEVCCACASERRASDGHDQLSGIGESLAAGNVDGSFRHLGHIIYIRDLYGMNPPH